MGRSLRLNPINLEVHMDSLVKRDTVNGRPAYSIKTDNGLPELITPGHAFYSLIAKLCEYEEAIHSGSLLNHNSS